MSSRQSARELPISRWVIASHTRCLRARIAPSASSPRIGSSSFLMPSRSTWRRRSCSRGLTAQFLLTSCYPVKAGDTVLVHAAAGGVGLLLGQWLKTLGATSIGTAGSPEKAAIAKANGYSHVIDYRAEDFVARVKEITGGRGCDVVYDSVGKDTWRGSLKCLRMRGMFVHFGQSSGMISDFKFSDLAAGGSLFATRPMLFDYIKNRNDLASRAADLFSRLASGDIKAHIGQRAPLRDAAAAHRDLESRRTIGATVLLP